MPLKVGQVEFPLAHHTIPLLSLATDHHTDFFYPLCSLFIASVDLLGIFDNLYNFLKQKILYIFIMICFITK
jgi:hypothetical protein